MSSSGLSFPPSFPSELIPLYARKAIGGSVFAHSSRNSLRCRRLSEPFLLSSHLFLRYLMGMLDFFGPLPMKEPANPLVNFFYTFGPCFPALTFLSTDPQRTCTDSKGVIFLSPARTNGPSRTRLSYPIDFFQILSSSAVRTPLLLLMNEPDLFPGCLRWKRATPIFCPPHSRLPPSSLR